jgi:2-C-methyl-D-erythritol 4-phosphate cytidylyltransferase
VTSGGAGPQVAAVIDELTRVVPNCPEPGVVFRDLTPVLADDRGFAVVTDALARIVEGADTRSGSVRSGLAALDGLADDDDVVVVHDAARPLASTALFDAVIDAVVAGADAAVPAIPVADTLKRVDVDGRVVETVDRNGLVWIQTPQAFRCGVLRAAHRGAPEATDDAGLVEAGGGVVVVVPGESANRKVTVAGDLDVVGEVLRAGVRP